MYHGRASQRGKRRRSGFRLDAELYYIVSNCSLTCSQPIRWKPRRKLRQKQSKRVWQPVSDFFRVLSPFSTLKHFLTIIHTIGNPESDEKIIGDPFCVLFVSRLSYNLTEDDLMREFDIYGPIKNVLNALYQRMILQPASSLTTFFFF
jgi:hypothetical protein